MHPDQALIVAALTLLTALVQLATAIIEARKVALAGGPHIVWRPVFRDCVFVLDGRLLTSAEVRRPRPDDPGDSLWPLNSTVTPPKLIRSSRTNRPLSIALNDLFHARAKTVIAGNTRGEIQKPKRLQDNP